MHLVRRGTGTRDSRSGPRPLPGRLLRHGPRGEHGDGSEHAERGTDHSETPPVLFAVHAARVGQSRGIRMTKATQARIRIQRSEVFHTAAFLWPVRPRIVMRIDTGTVADRLADRYFLQYRTDPVGT